MQKEDSRSAWRTRLARAASVAAMALACAAGAASVAACPPAQGPTAGGVEMRCTRACTERASDHCSEDECARGCRFVLDRLMEHEGDRVLDCVSTRAHAGAACDDTLFASCAVLIGEHADGGPPAPPPPEDL